MARCGFATVQISVNRTLHHLNNGQTIYRQPKTARSRRLIALSPSTAIILREHHEAQRKLRESLGMTLSDNDLVFCNYDGKPYLPNSITHSLIKLVRRSGLGGIRLYDCRHTHASLLLKQGTHPKIVQERLGHATISTTLDIYSHLASGLQQAAANRFDDVVLSKEKSLDKELSENALAIC